MNNSKKYNSGMTLVEIIISLCIISIVLVFLFTLLVQVRQEDEQNQAQSNYIINQATFIKSVEEDFVNYGVKSVSSCDLSHAGITNESVVAGQEQNFKCIRFEYAADYLQDKFGYLMIYDYYTTYDYVNGKYQGKDSSWMIQYVRGGYSSCNAAGTKVMKINTWKNATKVMKEIPDTVDLSGKPYVTYTANPLKSDPTIKHNAVAVVVPIIDEKGDHYDLNLSFMYSDPSVFKCKSDNNLLCNCTSNDGSGVESAQCQYTHEYSFKC